MARAYTILFIEGLPAKILSEDQQAKSKGTVHMISYQARSSIFSN
jgi:hypothetical protein